jgi:hypothetical protein
MKSEENLIQLFNENENNNNNIDLFKFNQEINSMQNEKIHVLEKDLKFILKLFQIQKNKINEFKNHLTINLLKYLFPKINEMETHYNNYKNFFKLQLNMFGNSIIDENKINDEIQKFKTISKIRSNFLTNEFTRINNSFNETKVFDGINNLFEKINENENEFKKIFENELLNLIKNQ